jgi:hypothetical protein
MQKFQFTKLSDTCIKDASGLAERWIYDLTKLPVFNIVFNQEYFLSEKAKSPKDGGAKPWV